MKIYRHYIVVVLALFLGIGGYAQSKKTKPVNPSNSKMTYQEAKRICLERDPGLMKQELKYCIKHLRKKMAQNKRISK